MSSPRLNFAFKVLLFICLVIGGNYLSHWIVESLDFEITPVNELTVHRIIIVSMLAYIVLMAIPFVPGAEIGLGFMMILGPKIVPLVYLCTLASLSLGYMIGKFIPEKNIVRLLQEVRLRKASQLMAELEGLDSQQRFDLLLERSPKVLVPFLLKHRYLALLVFINVPGNIVIGGGGGIAMFAGMSRLFTPTRYLVTIAFAVSPIPLFLLLFGENLADWPV